MADDQVTIDPEFSPRPDGGRGRWRWLFVGAAVVVAAFLFGWLMGSGTSGESDEAGVASSTSIASSVETTASRDAPSATTSVPASACIARNCRSWCETAFPVSRCR